MGTQITLERYGEVSLSDVERTLSQQLKAAQGPGDEPVILARMSNQIIYCNKPETANKVLDMIPRIAAAHPARFLLLVADPEQKSDADIVASVAAECHKLGPRHVCTELVILRAKESAVDRLSFAVRALLIGDLPTNLWWSSTQPPALAGPFLYDLAEYAQQLIYDSQGWQDPHRGVSATHPWLERFERKPEEGRWRIASDLNWRRLKYWRRLLGQVLDPIVDPELQASITEVLIEHGPHAVTQAWLLVGWLAARIGWQVLSAKVQLGVEISWRCYSNERTMFVRIRRLPEGASEVHKVRFACTLEGKPAAINCVVEEDGKRLSATPEGVEGASRTVTAPRQSIEELISRQLSDREPDPVFRESMEVAQVFAQTVVK